MNNLNKIFAAFVFVFSLVDSEEVFLRCCVGVPRALDSAPGGCQVDILFVFYLYLFYFICI